MQVGHVTVFLFLPESWTIRLKPCSIFSQASRSDAGSNAQFSVVSGNRGGAVLLRKAEGMMKVLVSLPQTEDLSYSSVHDAVICFVWKPEHQG